MRRFFQLTLGASCWQQAGTSMQTSWSQPWRSTKQTVASTFRFGLQLHFLHWQSSHTTIGAVGKCSLCLWTVWGSSMYDGGGMTGASRKLESCGCKINSGPGAMASSRTESWNTIGPWSTRIGWSTFKIDCSSWAPASLQMGFAIATATMANKWWILIILIPTGVFSGVRRSRYDQDLRLSIY